ncbi:hypothetical protein F4805DRAFT_413321 [Annulohypoxylon moriforme]|nr:hypothetical protein F4805DRAFT_413321 [Annulohypoxylon moriforme]
MATNFLSFLKRNGMDSQGITFHPKDIPAQVSPVSCGWICLESARAYLHEGLDDWSKSVLYRDFEGLEREKAAVANWASWSAVWWRGTTEAYFPIQEAQAQPEVHQVQEQAQPVQQAEQVEQVQAQEQSIQQVLEAQQVQESTAEEVIDTRESTPLAETPPPTTYNPLFRDRESRRELVDFLAQVLPLTRTPLSIREYHSILTSSKDFDEAVEVVLQRGAEK